MAQATAVLEISNLHSYYGESHILHGADLAVAPGELIALLGRNGSGRSTLLKSILGMVSRRTGSITVQGRETIQLESYQIARLGIGYCPEDRGIFSALTVEENLFLPPRVRELPRTSHSSPASDLSMSIDELFELFPNLKERLQSMGTRLSGGEQQMLAMARILRTGSPLLLLDEITEGLAPVIVQVLGRAIRKLKEKGFTIVLVEQNLKFTESLADRFYVMENGRIVEVVTKENLAENKDALKRHLTV